MAKYERLVDFLDQKGREGAAEFEVSFQEIESIIGAALPPAARNFRPWWANSGSTPKPWQVAGYKTRKVHLGRQTVVFRREHERTVPAAVGPPRAAERVPRILVITNGTGKKAVHHPQQLLREDFVDPVRLRRRERELDKWRLPAREMYCCEQVRLVVQGVEHLRHRFGEQAVDLRIVSPGYGLVGEHAPLVPHSVSFGAMNREDLHRWGEHIGIPRAVREAMQGYDLVLVLAGQDCLEAMRPPLVPEAGRRIVLLATERYRQRYVGPGVTVLLAGRSYLPHDIGLVALKGYLFERFAASVGSRPDGAEILWRLQREDGGQIFWGAVETSQAI